jgi:hypothetical protein
MRNLITPADNSNFPSKDVLPAPPADIPFVWTRSSKLAEFMEIVRATRLWPNVAITVNSSGLCFSVTGHSMGHLNWDGRLDVPFGLEAADQLARVEANTTKGDRSTFQVQNNADVDSAIRLLRLSYLIVDSKSPGMCS